jgi:hypothetical protein
LKVIDPEILRLVQKHWARGAVIDTNLLLVYLVGVCSEEWIREFKCTATYDIESFRGLLRFISQFHELIVTPHILSEVSNLGAKLGGRRSPRFFDALRTFVGEATERYEPARAPVANPHFPMIGVADSSIAELATQGFLVVTDDLRLAGKLKKQGGATVNFNHIRYFLGA